MTQCVVMILVITWPVNDTEIYPEMHSIAKITNTTTIPVINTPKIKVIAKITKATKLMFFYTECPYQHLTSLSGS